MELLEGSGSQHHGIWELPKTSGALFWGPFLGILYYLGCYIWVPYFRKQYKETLGL